jgi:hypothetical protein
MAIQQIVQLSLTLQGDGTTKVFRYTPSQLFAAKTNDGSQLLSLSTTPSSITAVSNMGGSIAASMSSGKFVLTFSQAPVSGKIGTVILTLGFVSQ